MLLGWLTPRIPSLNRMKTRLRQLTNHSLLLVVSLLSIEPVRAAQVQGTPLQLHTRGRHALAPNTTSFAVVEKTVEWDPHKTAIIVCDMWDRHWCKGATARVAELAPRMNEVLKEARRRGVFIIHAPSSTTKFYEGWPQRKRAQDSPKATPPKDVSQWQSLNRAKEPPLPIDDSDGGCDDLPQCPGGNPWKRQISTLEIGAEDAISDDGTEVYNLLHRFGRDNVIIMGVHENMCVLGRPFSIRQMVSLGKNVLLMRDMTDTMYNSRKAPYVSHFVGTDLVAEHIEKYWCPTITSADFLGGLPFRFVEDRRPRVVFVLGENEYRTWESLPQFADQELAGRGLEFEYVQAPPKGGNEFTNWQAIARADLIVLSVRRRTPIKPVINALRHHVDSGKPLVALRTASHAFGAKPPSDSHASWDTFDVDVLGAKYEGHFGNDLSPQIQPASAEPRHPILAGWPGGGFTSGHSLYRMRNPAPGVQLLLNGSIQSDGRGVTEPVAWINTNGTRRVFYTSLGGTGDFKQPAFRRLLRNAILWSLDLVVPPAEFDATSNAASAAGRDWQKLRVPGTWEDNAPDALRTLDGIAWYRCLVKLPDTWSQDVDLWIERIDNAHEAYVNGVRVGGAGSFPPAYQNGDSAGNRYRIHRRNLHFGGENLIAIRVYDDGGRGGFKGDAPALLHREDGIKLEGDWHFRAGDNPEWAKHQADLPEGIPQFDHVIDASAVSGRTYQHQAQEQPLSPAESLARFEIADDLEIEQVLTEPTVRQPVFLTFDERGRMWVVQYLQYPHPAGLKLMSRDNVWRAVYDKVPPPPPNHFPGADKVTIHEDTDGDGTFDRHKTFIEGLNIVTSVALGRGGVWILNPPYLLFYPDKDQDDAPDGPVEVRLSGFGLEDTHSVANSLRWGPDGWLYGCQGSTVTGNIIVYAPDGSALNSKPIFSQGQNIWRYHPEQRRYEVFAEGGGNAFGLEIDAQGRIFSGHNGGNTRGFHYVQGGYLQKGFEKHGPLSNPYAYGYFPPMPHNQADRFTHNFVLYESCEFPPQYQGKLLGVEPLQGRIVLSDFQREHSTFKTRDLDYPVQTTDRWFRPVDIKVGPEGAVYIADWYDGQVNHYRNHEGQIDKGNGRIYRLKSKGSAPSKPFNRARLSNAELLTGLHHTNKWVRQETLRLIADRRDATLAVPLFEMARTENGQTALEALWALHLIEGLTNQKALDLLHHREPSVRAWVVRLLGDRNSQELWGSLSAKLAQMAETDPALDVRSQLASSAKRLPANYGLPIVRGLLHRDEDAGEPRLPLLIWWAIETKADSHREEVLELFQDKTLWSRPLVQKQILERLMRRYAQAGTRKDLLTCARLLESAPHPESARQLMAGFEAAFKGRSITDLPEELLEAIAQAGGDSLALRVRRGQSDAIQEALRIVADDQLAKRQRLECIRLFSAVKQPQAIDALLKLATSSKDAELSKAALSTLQHHEDPAIGARVAAALPGLNAEPQTAAFVLLASRPSWASELVQAVNRGTIARGSVPQDVARRIEAYQRQGSLDPTGKLWKAQLTPTSAQMQARIQQLARMLPQGTGSPYEGQKVFNMACSACHKLFGQGGQIGPDLTTFKRDDLDNMLLNIVHPNAEIREGYETYLVSTKDGRTLSGFLADKDNRVIVLRSLDGENSTIPQDQITEMNGAGVSLMPEGLLDILDDQQIRDLFAYLRSTQPLVR